MPKLVTYKEFLEMCGTKEQPLSYQTLHAAIRRKQVKADVEKRRINPLLKINADWRKSRQQLQKSKNSDANEIYKIQALKRKLELQKVEEELAVVKFKRQKLEGELIPTLLVSGIFATHFKSITKGFHDAANQIATDAVKRLKGNEKDLAWIKGYLIPVINDAVTKARKVSEIEIKNIVKEYSKQNK